jgi:hypothetical protein
MWSSRVYHRQLLPIVVVTLLLLGPGSASGLHAQIASQGQVIAQGTASLPAEELIWWVERKSAPTETGGDSPYRPLGFILGDTGTTTIVSGGSPGRQLVWLDPGEALFLPKDQFQERFTTTPPAFFYTIDLIPATAQHPPAQPIGTPIVPALGINELTLVRDTLWPGGASYLPASSNPVLILATEGAVNVSSEGAAPFRLNAGQASTVTGTTTVTSASLDASTYVAALITPRDEQVPTTGAVDLGFGVSACPPGVTAQPDMSDLGCAFVDPLASGVDLQISGPALETPLTLANSLPADAGARVWTAVPFGDYTLQATLPPGASGYAIRATTRGVTVTPLPGGDGYALRLDGSIVDPRSDYWRGNFHVYLLYP